MKGCCNVQNIFLGLLSLIVVWAIPFPAVPFGIKVIEKITSEGNPPTLKVRLSAKTAHKIFQVDKRELIIAFKDAKLSKTALKKGVNSPVVKNIRIDQVPGNVVVLDVYTNQPLKGFQTQWINSDKTLALRLNPIQTQKEKTVPPQPRQRNTAPTIAPSAQLPIATLEALRRKSPDSIDGLLVEMRSSECIRHPDIRAALSICEKEFWQKAYDLLNRYIGNDTSKDCLAAAYFLRAYCYYKKMDAASEDKNLNAVTLFQEAVSYYPKSPYTPYGIAVLGKINHRLRNFDAARGFFKVILDSYQKYPGIPEVMLELAKVYVDKEKAQVAVSIIERLIPKYPNSPFVSDAKMVLAKAFFKANNFQESLTIAKNLLKSDPRIIFSSSDLLVCLGNSYYQLGNLSEARNALLRAMNCFPDMPENNMVLSRVGDIFRDENQPEKAQKIYEHVVKNYPGSDGYIISSVRMAEYLKRRAEKENLYRTIISDFPDHSLAQLAYLKLANLLSKEGEHEKSINTLQDFLSKYPGALKKEAVHVLNEAYGALFQKLLEVDDPAGVLTWFERDRTIINRINNPDLFLMVGRACVKGHLYKEAADLLQKAYTLFEQDKRSPELRFNLGVALHASGSPDQALKVLDAYARAFPQHIHLAEAYGRIGQILMAKKDYKNALKKLMTALQHTQNKADKAAILICAAKADKALMAYQTAAHRLIQAIDYLASDPEQPNDAISKLYRNLGETYLKGKAYRKSADAFAMALKFSEKKDDPDLRFLLGEAYEKGHEMQRAGKVYQEIIDLGDPFWTRLAQEKLRGIQIETQLNPKATLSG